MTSQPPQLQRPAPFFQSDRIRISIITSYWVVVLLAVPLWWSTTTIERLRLPTQRVTSLQETLVKFPVKVVVGSDGFVPPGRVEDLVKSLAAAAQESHKWQALDLHFSTSNKSNTLEDHYSVVLKGEPQNLDTEVKDRVLALPFIDTSTTSQEIISKLQSLLVPYPEKTQDLRVAQYAPRYRLSFSLLNEDSSAGSAALDWELKEAIEAYLLRSLNKLELLHNFTIESQVQYHAPLAFEPVANGDQNESPSYGLTEDHLKIFVNSAEWTLASSISNDPVLHFLLFIPSANRRPLNILQHEAQPTNSNAFIIPQWGGIVVYNPSDTQHDDFQLSASDLRETFGLFHTQLHTLLGVPSILPGAVSSTAITRWQLDALMRRRTLENVQGSSDAMKSIVKLVEGIRNMPVKEDVRNDVTHALDALDEVRSTLSELPEIPLHHSSRALTLSSRAFFNPGMVAMLYFPAEHKYAVYTPLFAPVAVPLVVALIRELRGWKQRRTAEALRLKNE